MDKSGSSLKDTLEKIWQDPKCLCPSHRVWWILKPEGYWIHGMSYRRGQLVQLKGVNRKKGYSYLCKNYGLYSRMRRGK